MTLQRTSAVLSALLLWMTLDRVESFPQDWKSLIPAADLASVTSGALQKAPLPPALYQEDLKGCNADKNPGCPHLTFPTDFYKSPENDKIILAYDFDANLAGDSQLVPLILSAFEKVERDTDCVRFMQPKDVYVAGDKSMPELPVLMIKKDKTCSASFPGVRSAEDKNMKIEYPITLNKDCIAGKEGNVHRLLMLAMGFPHEHVRSDRDDYISVNMDNVIPAREREFDKNPPDLAYLDQYDYESVLHPAYVFSAVDPKVPTIVAKNGAKLGQREQMSSGDAEKIKRLVCEGIKTKPLKTSRPNDDAGATPAPAKPTKKRPTDDPDDEDVVKPTIPLPPATPAPKPSFVLPPLTAPQPVPERPGPSPAIAPTGTQKCGKDLYLKIMNSQTWYQTAGDAHLEAGWMASQFTTRWFMPPPDASEDYLTSTVAFKVNDTVTGDAVPAAVKVLVNEISKRVFRTEYQTQTLSDGGYVLNTKFETILASCVPLSDFPKRKQKA